jgi:hypothetical protein
MKEFDWNKAVVSYLVSRGGRVVKKAFALDDLNHQNGETVEIETRFGSFSVCPMVWKENRRNTHYTVFGKFKDNLKSVQNKLFLGSSLKWNHHYGAVPKANLQKTFEIWKDTVRVVLFPCIYVMRKSEGSLPLETIEIRDVNPRVVELIVKGLWAEVIAFNRDHVLTEEPKYIYLVEVSEYLTNKKIVDMGLLLPLLEPSQVEKVEQSELKR